MNKSTVSTIVLTIVCVILGIALSLQFKNTYVNAEKMKLEKKNIQDIMAELLTEKDKVASLKKQLDEYDNKIQQYVNAEVRNNSVVDILRKDLEEAKVLAGLTDITAEGIIVRIDNTDSGWVNDSDLLTVLNDLRAAGSYAQSINGERVIATTEVRRAGSYVIINDTRYSTPFTILALGNPDTLEASLKLRNGVYDTFTKKFNLDVKIEKSSNITVPKYTGVRSFQYAKPVGGS